MSGTVRKRAKYLHSVLDGTVSLVGERLCFQGQHIDLERPIRIDMQQRQEDAVLENFFKPRRFPGDPP